jgi:hypothetical protein
MNQVDVVVASLESAPAIIVPLVREVPSAILSRHRVFRTALSELRIFIEPCHRRSSAL